MNRKINLSLFVALVFSTPAISMEQENWEMTPPNKNSMTLQIYPEQNAYEQNKGFTNLYSRTVPKAPVIQEYDLNGHGHSEPMTYLFMHLPRNYVPNLSQPIQDALLEDKTASVRLFVVGQSQPYVDKTDPNSYYGFYPQYGTDPLAPNKGPYFAIRKPKVRVLLSDSRQVKLFYIDRKESPQQVQITEEPKFAMTTVSSMDSVIHPGCTGDHKKPCTHGNTCPSFQVVSPQPLGVSGINEDVGQSFWSMVSYNDGYSNQAIVTLHLLFDGTQQMAFGNLADTLKTKAKNDKVNCSKNEVIDFFNQAKELPAFKGRGGHFIKLLNVLK
jgi:hypothetical protein